MVNIAVVIGCMPTTGVTAPFISYGGSSMLSALISVGLLWGVSLKSQKDEEKESRIEHEPTRLDFEADL